MLLEKPGPIEASPLRLIELADPVPPAHHVRLKVTCCAICRTDLHVVEADLPVMKTPVIPGHQIVGVVDQRGPGCTRLKVGQRVGVAWLRHTCGSCGFCSVGRENLCESARFTGYHADGGYAEYAVVNEDYAYPVPDCLTDVQAAPLLCAGIIGYRSLRRCGLPDGGTLGLWGFGSSAHVVLQIARHRGCAVYVVTRGQSHRDLARRMGAAWVGPDADSLPVKLDAAIIFAPAGELVPTALASLNKGATLALAGIHMSPIPPLDYHQHLFFERDIHPVTANTRDDGRALFAEAPRVPVQPHTKTYPLRDANRALQDLKQDRIDGSGVLMMRD